MQKIKLLILASAGLLIIDRLLKQVARQKLLDISWFKLFFNRGIIFSFPAEGIATNTIIALIILTLIYLLVANFKTWPARLNWSLTLIIIGAISNYFDRLVYGAVIDYLSFTTRMFFNLADIYILIGFILLILQTTKNKQLGRTPTGG